MIDWKYEVNLSLRRLGLSRELDYSESIQLILDLYERDRKGYLWLQNVFFENRVSYFSIRKLLKKEGITIRPRGGKNRCLKMEIPVEDLQNLSITALCTKYCVSSATILQRRKLHGVTRKHTHL